MKANSLLLILGLTFLLGCNGKTRVREGVMFPNRISPIYYLDTFQIQSPIIIIDDNPYILPKLTLDNFNSIDSLLNKKEVLRYFDKDLAFGREIGYINIYRDFNKKSLYNINEQSLFYYEDVIHATDTINGVIIYEFDYEPKMFILALTSDKMDLIMEWSKAYDAPSDDQIKEFIFSRNYMLVLSPIFDKSAIKKIQNKIKKRLDSYES